MSWEKKYTLKNSEYGEYYIPHFRVNSHFVFAGNSTFRNSSSQCAADVCTSVTHHKGAANTLALSVSGSFAKATGRLPVLLNYSNKKEPIILSFFLLAFIFHFRSKTRGIRKVAHAYLHRIK